MQVYNMFHRVNMHQMLMESATGAGEGEPAVLKLNHACESIDHETGTISFENQITAQHDLVVGADGIGVSIATMYVQELSDRKVCRPSNLGHLSRKETIQLDLLPLYPRNLRSATSRTDRPVAQQRD